MYTRIERALAMVSAISWTASALSLSSDATNFQDTPINFMEEQIFTSPCRAQEFELANLRDSWSIAHWNEQEDYITEADERKIEEDDARVAIAAEVE